MENTLRIGTSGDIFISWAAEQMFDSLSAKGIRCELIPMEAFSSGYEISDLNDAIFTNKIDTAPFELSCLPVFSGDEEIIISAISGRNLEGEGILIKKNKTETSGYFKMNAGSVIGVKTERQYQQLHHLFPDQTFIIVKDVLNVVKTATIPDDTDGIILSKLSYAQLSNLTEDYTFIGLHPKELIPSPGHGVVAYLCHKEDINTRNILQQIHEKSMVQKVNTERIVLKMAGSEFIETLGVFCQVDLRGNFHVHAVRCDEFRKVSFSQSISTGLAEKIYQSLFF